MIDIKTLSDKELLKLKGDLERKISQSNNLQMGLKILLNAGYGALAEKNFLYFLIDNAEAITTSGQLVNKWTSYRVNILLNNILGTKDKDYLVAADTDSGYYVLSDIAKLISPDINDVQATTDAIDNFIKTILAPEIKKYTEELCDYLNNIEDKMVWEREKICRVAIHVAKKKYIMYVIDSEGVRYSDLEFSMTGMEAKKSDTPEWAKVHLIECYKMALNGEQEKLQKYVKQVRKLIKTLPPSDLALPKGITEYEKYVQENNTYGKGTPFHVKAAITHNKLIDNLGLHHIKKISGGDNIKLLELKQPNPTNEPIIAFDGFLPKEFELESYINYSQIFYKGFERPLQILLNSIGWTTEEIVTLF